MNSNKNKFEIIQDTKTDLQIMTIDHDKILGINVFRFLIVEFKGFRIKANIKKNW